MAAAIERKLTTLFSADVVGYGRLMGQDERGTLATLRTYREVMANLIANHHGRVVNTAGDSLLAEFASVVAAVECAVQVQREVAERNAAVPPDRQMRFRIGVNLGDVMVDGTDLHGDSVNVAARLQALADPGGILISGPVFDQVKNKLALGFDYLGPTSVKNIAADVPIYRVLLKPDAAAPSEAGGGASATDKPATGHGARRRVQDPHPEPDRAPRDGSRYGPFHLMSSAPWSSGRSARLSEESAASATARPSAG